MRIPQLLNWGGVVTRRGDSRYFDFARYGGVGDSLTAGGQFALRSEMGEQIRISRIARPVALYDDAVAARTFGDFSRYLENPSVFAETTDPNYYGGRKYSETE